MKRAFLILSLSLILYSCSTSHRSASMDYNHVSDVELDPEVKGITYDKGNRHPTLWETIFGKLGIK